MYNKKTTSNFTDKDGVINYSTDVNYWDARTGKYRIFTQKAKISIYRDNDIVNMFDRNPKDLGYLLILFNSMDNNNMIGLYNQHLRHYAPITSKQGLYKLLGIARNAGAAFYAKLQDYAIIKEWHNDDGDTVYFINPAYTMSDRGITLTTYKLFKRQLDKILPYKARTSLEALCSDRCADNSQVVTYDISDNVFVDGVYYNPVDEIAASSEADKQAVFNEYILQDQPAKTYQKIGKGMIAHDQTDDNDTYFVVNQTAEYKVSKPAKADITGYNAWYIDIDAGRDSNGNYFSLEEVAERKIKMMTVINALPTPTAVVNTRNGYHVYYACFGIEDADVWQNLQDKLIESAKIADPACRDASRLLRLPNSKWIKAHTGLAPYPVTILQANKQAYDAASFATQLDACSDKVTDAAKAYNVSYPMATAKKSRTATAGARGEQTPRINAIADLSTDTFTLSTSVETINNINTYLKQINLAEFLQIENPSSFNCILHDDRNPSATIYQNETGYRYYCASDCVGHGDGKGIDIIDIVQNLAGCSYKQAVNYLCRLYGVRQQQIA